jgi:hypothetical protein
MSEQIQKADKKRSRSDYVGANQFSTVGLKDHGSNLHGFTVTNAVLHLSLIDFTNIFSTKSQFI